MLKLFKYISRLVLFQNNLRIKLQSDAYKHMIKPMLLKKILLNITHIDIKFLIINIINYQLDVDMQKILLNQSIEYLLTNIDD